MSSCVNYTEMYQHVMPELPGCPKPLVMAKIRKIIREFCTETQVFTYELDAINVRDGVDTYDLDIPTCASMDTIKMVELDGVEIYPVGDPRGNGYSMPNKCQIKLYNEPTRDIEQGLEVEIVLRPIPAGTKICCSLYEDYYQAWAYGVMAELMDQPGKSWSDSVTAGKYNGYYLDEKGKCRIEQSRGSMNLELQARSPYEFA